jgi:hypothetical protein
MGSFADTIREWGNGELDRHRAIFQTAVDIVVNEVTRTVYDGGRMPIDTGNLRRSLTISKTAMPQIRPDQTDFTEEDVAAVILTLFLGDTAYIGFQAAYAARMEYGFVGTDALGRMYNQQGYGFVAAVAQRWDQIIAEAERVVGDRYATGSN